MNKNTPITIKLFCKIYPWPSESAMRSYIFRRKAYGIESCFLKFGKRILVYPETFFKMIKDIHTKRLNEEK